MRRYGNAVLVLVLALAFSPSLAGALTLALAGDVMLGRLVNGVMAKSGPAHVWGDALPLLRSADLTLVNLECVIAAGGEPFQPRRVFYFRAGPRGAEALALAGIDAVSLANNHAMDFRAEGLLETIRRLDERAIAHAGAGRDLAAAARPAILERGGVKLGIVAFADHFEEYAAGEARPGTNVIRIRTEGEDFDRVKRAIRAARRADADLVLFSIHWGPNMREAPAPEFVEFARAVVDAGADVVHGHSAHLFQAIEIHRGKAILYDTGDLVDDYYVDPALRNDRQILFLLEVGERGVSRIELVPLRIHHMQVNRARGGDFTAIRDRIRALSRPFGTEIVEERGRLMVRMPVLRQPPAALDE